MLKNLGFDMTSSKKENGANRDQDEIGELGSLFQKTYTVIVQIGSNFTICNVSAHSHCSHFNVLHIFSLRGGSRNLFSPSHNRILAPHLCLSPTFPLCSCQSCPGETFQNIIIVFKKGIFVQLMKTTKKEYERAVIFRLGRLLTGGARGPGVFFIIPCVDVFEKIDMRTMTYEIPPQEVSF